MAKEIAITKRAKITEAQQYVLLSVLGASIFLGTAISLTMHFVNVIQFNAEVIAAEEASIVSYSNAIKNMGICKSPKGSIYSDQELKDCNPASINVKDVPGTLRANILENIASNQALNSVPKKDNDSCINQASGKKYTYDEMMKLYNSNSSEEQTTASILLRRCSALRIIPDALPTYKNEDALLSSINQIYNISDLTPNGLNPAGSSEASSLSPSLNLLTALFSSDESPLAATVKFLDNVERSIRDFRIESATLSWENNGVLKLDASAKAYYMNPSVLEEITRTIKGNKESK